MAAIAVDLPTLAYETDVVHVQYQRGKKLINDIRRGAVHTSYFYRYVILAAAVRHPERITRKKYVIFYFVLLILQSQ